jgi:hypothetical protein
MFSLKLHKMLHPSTLISFFDILQSLSGVEQRVGQGGAKKLLHPLLHP